MSTRDHFKLLLSRAESTAERLAYFNTTKLWVMVRLHVSSFGRGHLAEKWNVSKGPVYVLNLILWLYTLSEG